MCYDVMCLVVPWCVVLRAVILVVRVVRDWIHLLYLAEQTCSCPKPKEELVVGHTADKGQIPIHRCSLNLVVYVLDQA